MTVNRLAAPETCDVDIAPPSAAWRGQVNGGHADTHSRWTDRRGALMHELLKVDGLDTPGPAVRPVAPTPTPEGPTQPK